MNWVVDTGAQVSVVPKSVFDTYRQNFEKLGPLRDSNRKLIGAGNKTLNCVGYVTVELGMENTGITEQVYIVDGATKLLLGLPAIRKFGLIPSVPKTFSITAVELQNRDGVYLRTTGDVKDYKPELAGPLGKWKGKTVHITQSEGAEPSNCTTARRVALPLMSKAKAEIQRMENLDVIEPVDEPSDWCSPIVVVPKSNGKDVRICVDLTRVNKAVKREVYQMPSVETTINKIAARSVYSKLDCNSGYFQLELDDASRKLTTFITPFGRFRFKRMPYGISSGPEIFQKYMDEALSDIPGVVVQMDDILVEGSDCAEHDARLKSVLDKLAELGLTLNLDKCIIAETKLEYLGQMVDGGTIRKDPSKVQAIHNISEPTNTTELRRFLGVVNQLMKFCPNLSDLTKPLRDLLKKDSVWQWGPEQAQAFEKLKQELTSDRVLSMYDPNRETVVTADASSYGLGAVICQRQENGEMKPIAYASRSMTETECRYAQIEKEALAITWAMEHWADLLVGLQKLKVETDHKPLVPLLSTKYIHELPIRVQRFRMRLMRFNFTITHVPGKYLYTADALSRDPDVSAKAQESLRDLNELVETYVNTIMVTLPVVDSRLDEIRLQTKRDDELKVVMHYVQHGWPERSPKGPFGKYWKERGNISLHEGLLMRGSRIMIPQSMQPDVLRYLHDGHQGITKTRAKAADSVWWPGISRDIDKVVRNCAMCEKYRRERVEPMKGFPFPERPWSLIGSDFFDYGGRKYILVVDYYSRDVEICVVSKNVDASETILRMKKIFSRHGIPDILVSDNGPQYSADEFSRFAKDWGFEHFTSSPEYPQANGEAERMVETMKAILKKASDEYLALLMYRATPLQNGYSHAELSIGRKLKTRVPCHPEELKPRLPDDKLLRKRENEYRVRMKEDYDRRHNVFTGDEICSGDKVYIPGLKKEGIVIARQEPRSLVIQTPNSIVRRNRRMVRRSLNTEPPLPPQPPEPPEQYKYHEEKVVPVAEQSRGPTRSPVSEMRSPVSETREPVSESVPVLRRSLRESKPTRRFIEQY